MLAFCVIMEENDEVIRSFNFIFKGEQNEN